ncbi:creatininase family protein [Streptomyces aidingensis]|uniref:Creatinine amidohydrolase/Fe(II)-dependent formamide hydrolase involved in riboflavin and F420 biosynthesis n=1 Tax=Streptomyces aidingensis TaxID=910347 RepID=A0A1I1KML7_9ACTN|nr:creatininase family protein [Streptomyces aidingensis]SFC62116.1 Creatinine amidohydrolase/Fe(II)-dependent formamide hydrolase involved in riboflavin and F420 biosynthesis [Streptomyces aidingensis]
MTGVLSRPRHLARLKADQVAARLTERSILCLPLGALEQHGPHLPLDTDTVIAERFSALLAERYGEHHDLWILPPVPYGLSHEHTWSPGTVSLDIAEFTGYLTRIVRGHITSTPARRLLVVNGRPEIHAGARETSLMLALASQDVDVLRLRKGWALPPVGHLHTRVLDRGVTWPWSTDAPELAVDGVMGSDPRSASAEFGEALLSSALRAAGDVLSAIAARHSRDRAQREAPCC